MATEVSGEATTRPVAPPLYLAVAAMTATRPPGATASPRSTDDGTAARRLVPRPGARRPPRDAGRRARLTARSRARTTPAACPRPGRAHRRRPGRPARRHRRRLPAPAPALAPARRAARAEPRRHVRRAANVVWTDAGPVRGRGLRGRRAAACRAATGVPVTVLGVDKFPRMIDYVVPSGVRIADADRVRLGAHLAAGTTVMHEGFVNFNAGTLGTSMVEGRISAGVVVGDGSDIGGGASIMGTLSGGGTRGRLDRRALPARRQRRPRHHARRRLRGRGRPLRHRRHQGALVLGRRRRSHGGQGARALRRATTCCSAATR